MRRRKVSEKGEEALGKLAQEYENTRWLEDSHRYVRSDVLDKLTKEDIRFLEAHNIRTVVDLRDEAERGTPALCAGETGGVHLLPSAGHRREFCAPFPRRSDPFLYPYGGCTNGEDLENHRRSPHPTRWIPAVQAKTGPGWSLPCCSAGWGSEDEIVQDYMQSKENLKEGLEQYAKMTGAPLSVITPAAQYMEAFLAWLEQEKSPIAAWRILTTTKGERLSFCRFSCIMKEGIKPEGGATSPGKEGEKKVHDRN